MNEINKLPIDGSTAHNVPVQVKLFESLRGEKQ